MEARRTRDLERGTEKGEKEKEGRLGWHQSGEYLFKFYQMIYFKYV